VNTFGTQLAFGARAGFGAAVGFGADFGAGFGLDFDDALPPMFALIFQPCLLTYAWAEGSPFRAALIVRR
jgi:hypothetical protein